MIQTHNAIIEKRNVKPLIQPCVFRSNLVHSLFALFCRAKRNKYTKFNKCVALKNSSMQLSLSLVFLIRVTNSSSDDVIHLCTCYTLWEHNLESQDGPVVQPYTIVRLLVSPQWGFSGLIYNTLWGTLARLLVTQFTINFMEVKDAPVQIRLDHNSRDYVPYSSRIGSGFFNVPYYLISNKSYEMGPPVYSPYPRRPESLTICRCNYKGSTFSSVILRP